MLSNVHYLPDSDVDDALDSKLRALLGLCFGESFKNKRYCFEMPPHRWLVYDDSEIAAHLAIHEKVFKVEGKEEPFLGVAEVCVAPAYRGRGLVREMLKNAEDHFPTAAFSILLGERGIYGSSGYLPVDNVYFPYKNADVPDNDVLVKALKNAPWPEGKVVIEGPPF